MCQRLSFFLSDRCRPAAIIKSLDLRKPQYKQLAAYGHMGREDLDVAWEKTDKINDLLKAVK